MVMIYWFSESFRCCKRMWFPENWRIYKSWIILSCRSSLFYFVCICPTFRRKGKILLEYNFFYLSLFSYVHTNDLIDPVKFFYKGPLVGDHLRTASSSVLPSYCHCTYWLEWRSIADCSLHVTLLIQFAVIIMYLTAAIFHVQAKKAKDRVHDSAIPFEIISWSRSTP